MNYLSGVHHLECHYYFSKSRIFIQSGIVTHAQANFLTPKTVLRFINDHIPALWNRKALLEEILEVPNPFSVSAMFAF